MQQSYPVFLDLTARRILIVGAGKVAARKVRGLLDAGAKHLRIVAPNIDATIPSSVERHERPFHPDDLKDVDLCFATTDDPALNQQIAELCRARRILVNRADAGEEGDFTVPAVHRCGALTVAVSASGSPRLAAAVRDQVALDLDPAWGDMAGAVQQLRAELLQSDLTESQRRPILLELCAPEALVIFKQGGKGALKIHLRQRFSHLGELASW